MTTMIANAIPTCPNLARVKRGSCSGGEKNPNGTSIQRVCLQFQCSGGRRKFNGVAKSKALGHCSEIPFYGRSIPSSNSRGSVSARFSAEQTQTITREAPTMTHVPGKEKSPQLDDGDSGLPPRDDDDGDGGGGGGDGWSGGFFFFGFLAFLGLLKDKESEDE